MTGRKPSITPDSLRQRHRAEINVIRAKSRFKDLESGAEHSIRPPEKHPTGSVGSQPAVDRTAVAADAGPIGSPMPGDPDSVWRWTVNATISM